MDQLIGCNGGSNWNIRVSL